MTAWVRKMRQSIEVNKVEFTQHDLDNIVSLTMLCLCGGFILLALEPIIQTIYYVGVWECNAPPLLTGETDEDFKQWITIN